MKKFRNSILAVTALVLGFGVTGCNNNEMPDLQEAVSTTLSLRVSGSISSTRGTGSVEEPGINEVNTIQLENGHIILLSDQNSMIAHTALVVDEVRGAGQTIQNVPSDARVYIIGNIPANVDFVGALTNPSNGLNSLASIRAFTASMASQGDYTTTVLSNFNNQSAPIVLDPADDELSSVVVSINPAISRLELHQIYAKQEADSKGIMTGYTVTGVFLDDYHEYFTFGGGAFGNPIRILQNPDNFKIGLPGTWKAAWTMPFPGASLGNAWVSTPTGDNAWTFNVAAQGVYVPRLVIRLEDIEYTDNNDDPQTIDGIGYVTITGYSNASGTFTTFERGRIYRIGAERGFTFGPADIHKEPNPEGIRLDVTVNIMEWILEDLNGHS
jgi:hypothetical protein